MGSASLGGGSGSFGGGSGSSKRGGGGGSAGGGKTDSVLQRFQGLLQLTRNLNATPGLAASRVWAYGMLQDRGRGQFVVACLGSSEVQRVYQDLLRWGEAWRERGDATAVAALTQVDPARATLRDLAYQLVAPLAQAHADERFLEITRATVVGILNHCVKDASTDLYARKPLDQLGGDFDPSSLNNVAGLFLEGILGGVLRRDALRIEPAVQEGLATAIHEIATSWVDTFIDKHRKGQVGQGDMLKIISEKWTVFSRGRA